MMYRFSSFVLALLLLVASGQASAAAYASKSATPSLTTLAGAEWGADAAVCTAAAGTSPATATLANTDTYTLCGTGFESSRALVAITTLTGTIPITTAITIQAGASVTASGAVTTSGSITNSGTLVVSGTNQLTMAASSTLTNGGTLTLGTATTAHSLVNLTTSVGGGTTTLGNATISGNLTVSSPSTLALAATNTVTGSVTTYGTALTGTLKFIDTAVATHTITASADSTIQVLDLSSMTSGSTIATATSNVVVTSLILPTANPVGGAAKTAIFTVPTTKTLTIGSGIPSGCSLSGGTTSGNAITTGTGTATLTCTITPSIAAPIISTKEKAAVFGQEVK